MKFRVAHKGLILVGIPLVFELILFGGMLLLLNQAEETAKKATHSRQVLAAVDQLTADIVDVHRNFGDRQLAAHEFDAETLKAQVHNLATDADVLKQLVKGDPKGKALVEDFYKGLNNIEASLPELFKAYEQNDFKQVVAVGFRYKQELRNILKKGASWGLLAFAREQKDIEEQEPVQQAQFRERTKTLLEAGLALSVALSVLLAVFFARQIARRLDIIAQNNKRLLSGEQLLPVVKGSDEIADLDVAFHTMTDELRAARERDIAVQRLRDQVVAMVTHDLRTPLQTVSAFLEYVEGTLEQQAKELWKTAKRNVERMGRLMKDLLELEKLQAGMLSLDKTEFAVSLAVAEAEELVSSIANQKNVSISIKGESRVVADEHRIVQVLANLLSNAVKYSPENATVQVRISANGGSTSIEVEDSGRGIPPEMAETVFEPFKQAKSTDATQFGGMGLGLSICKALVELHGGTISVKSPPGQGSIFSFTIPTC